MSNVKRGLYRNKLGAELTVSVPASSYTCNVNTLGDDISIAASDDDLYLVTAESLRQAGYELVEAERHE